MATPTKNSTFVSHVNPYEGHLIAGTKWGIDIGRGVELSYSFPTGQSSYEVPYSDFGREGEWASWIETTRNERAAIEDALSAWAAVADIAFVRTTDNRTTVGELRFAKTSVGPRDAVAHAYPPSSHPSAGDVWFRVDRWHADSDEPILRGSLDYLVMLHEIGHALGLKHPFDEPNPLPPWLDDFSSTVMSYTAWAGIEGDEASFYPTTPMYYDLAAIQTLYGRGRHNPGNTKYTFREGETYFQTLDDTGGRDMIVFAGERSCRIDLRDGNYCNVSEPITFGDEVRSRSTVRIGPDTDIEKARGGEGNDALIGNSLSNALYGRGGRDTLIGNLGRDKLHGGADADRFDFNAVKHSPRGAQHDTVADFSRREGDLIDLSSIDADTSRNPGNDGFEFIGNARFAGGGGELRFARHLVQADVDGDAIADLEIRVDGITSRADDFLL